MGISRRALGLPRRQVHYTHIPMNKTPLSLFAIGLVLLSSSCSGTGYFAQRGSDFADCFVGTVGFGLEVSASVEATDLAHVMVGGGLHVEAGVIGRRRGSAAMASLGLPVAPFLESGILYGRYVFTEVGGEWRLEDTQDECYLVHALGLGHTNPDTDLWHAFDLEVAAMAGIGVRVGFRPGEFVDFLTGIFGADPIGDDRLAQLDSPTPPPAEEP
ncbi:MAG: hypothetical protein ACI82F_003250 [Planctomycetota bacterium]